MVLPASKETRALRARLRLEILAAVADADVDEPGASFHAAAMDALCDALAVLALHVPDSGSAETGIRLTDHLRGTIFEAMYRPEVAALVVAASDTGRPS